MRLSSIILWLPRFQPLPARRGRHQAQRPARAPRHAAVVWRQRGFRFFQFVQGVV
jgi:hypothetical protein